MRVFLLVILGCLALPAFSQNWKLIWSDEFNGPSHTAPDTSKWNYDLGGGGWGNQELETYTNQLENAQLDGKGHLVITAGKKHSVYTSARLKTQGKFAVQYGKIVARMKIPYGQGVWTAFWMLGADIDKVNWPQSGEIDTMENIGKEPDTVHGTIHGPGYSGAKSIGKPYTPAKGVPLANAFHTYGVEWSPETITFAIDDHPYFMVTPKSLPDRSKWVFEHPFFLLLNLAVGGAWPGNPDKTTRFPARLIVDWVRVWQR